MEKPAFCPQKPVYGIFFAGILPFSAKMDLKIAF